MEWPKYHVRSQPLSSRLLICGEKDAAGSARDYNKRWAAAENLDLHWIAAAGHNSNTDKPDEVNTLIEEFWDRMR